MKRVFQIISYFKNLARTVRNVIIITVLLIVVLKVGDVFIDLDDIINWGCDTELCCEDCDTITVTRVIDGDTLVSTMGRVRLYGVDTPEVGQRCASEATDRLRELAGDTVRVEPGPRSKDPYGRHLFYLYTDDAESIDEGLVNEGLAVAWLKDGQHMQYLSDVEMQAREKDVGCLW